MISRMLGRIVPKDWRHVEKYPIRAIMPKVVAVAEYVFPIEDAWREFYDQNGYSACVGFGTCFIQTINNGGKLYNGVKHWNKSKQIDEFGWTNPGDNEGTSVRAGMDVLRKWGCREVIKGKTKGWWTKGDGIKENRWATTVDEMRTAIALKLLVGMGINWHRAFNTPELKDGKYWIGKGKLGPVEGGHFITAAGVSDLLQGFLLQNSWGPGYPPVWIPYKTIEKLLKDEGEAVIVTDKLGS